MKFIEMRDCTFSLAENNCHVMSITLSLGCPYHIAMWLKSLLGQRLGKNVINIFLTDICLAYRYIVTLLVVLILLNHQGRISYISP